MILTQSESKDSVHKVPIFSHLQEFPRKLQLAKMQPASRDERVSIISHGMCLMGSQSSVLLLTNPKGLSMTWTRKLRCNRALDLAHGAFNSLMHLMN